MHEAMKFFEPETVVAVCKLWQENRVNNIYAPLLGVPCCPVGAALHLEKFPGCEGALNLMPGPSRAIRCLRGISVYSAYQDVHGDPAFEVFTDFMRDVDACKTKTEVLAVIGCEEESDV